MATRAAAASEGHVAQAAREALARGNAVDAVVAGLLAAVAQSPGVLLGPVQLLVAGTGVGRIAVDGRLRQPGLGLPRPRGAPTGGAIPAAARVAAPALPAAIVTVLAAHGTATLRRLAGPALKVARACSPERAVVLDALARRGTPALADDAIASELLAVGGRAAGGSLTLEDLTSVRPELARIEERAMTPPGWVRVPWLTEGLDATFTQVVAAADGRGLVCIAAYETPVEGVAIPALGLLAPAAAVAVLHGKPRVRPGAPLPAAAPVAIRARRGQADLAVGLAGVSDADASLERALPVLDEAPLVGDALARVTGCAVAVVRTRDAAMVAASA